MLSASTTAPTRPRVSIAAGVKNVDFGANALLVGIMSSGGLGQWLSQFQTGAGDYRIDS